MKLKLLLITLLACFNTLFSQVIYEAFDSYKLGEKRNIKIQLPNNYNPEDDLKYPIVLVLDGDYLFEPIVGNINYQAYWGEIPDCIIVGVSQAKTRLSDFEYSNETFLPSQDGAAFFEFISMELLPYIDARYKTSSFKVVAAHDLAANFINFYLFKKEPLFNAYIAISPEFSKKTPSRLSLRLSNIESEKQLFYYLATSDTDIKGFRSTILEADSKLKDVSNTNLHYKFDDFEDANHYTIVGQAIPSALSEIFQLYKPITKKDYTEDILTFGGSTFEYLEQKYDNIEDYYGLKKVVIENDLRAIAAACKKRGDNESLLELAKIARKTYPDSMIGAYYYGIYYEAIGNYKKALQRYQSGLLLMPSQFIDKDILLEKIYEIKEERF
ncbi:alpha/beta hydrolase [Algibacter mikhailovii]|uniref:Histidine kinase n=1 Tax=Algibacter mikhailovii TaxID=425498 RepID=A0A918R2R4_9FLAO|nr:alpha/beta hydrolase-fold protein [Algibacter mikhailovii]GGZ84605.1 histidine kinase [Algibacter mikhailovii]